MIVVFIAGGSASGKTELAKQLLDKLQKNQMNCLSIKMDDYYKEMPASLDIDHYKATTNFDDPDCLDLPLLREHMIHLEQGKSIDKPVFDFKRERRIKTEKVTPPQILLLEGTASLYFANHFLPDLHTTFKIFIEVKPEILLKRRIQRDLIERGYGNEKRITQKDTEYVRPTFFKCIEPTKHFADMLIQNNETYDFNEQRNFFISWAEKISKKIKKSEWRVHI
ncbi:MAG: zeta toxin family protein [Silvanigrellaceae bacterium]|nr:zeta toxin family protein [Silvanigrellaceae bacterium]